MIDEERKEVRDMTEQEREDYFREVEDGPRAARAIFFWVTVVGFIELAILIGWWSGR